MNRPRLHWSLLRWLLCFSLRLTWLAEEGSDVVQVCALTAISSCWLHVSEGISSFLLMPSTSKIADPILFILFLFLFLRAAQACFGVSPQVLCQLWCHFFVDCSSCQITWQVWLESRKQNRCSHIFSLIKTVSLLQSLCSLDEIARPLFYSFRLYCRFNWKKLNRSLK